MNEQQFHELLIVPFLAAQLRWDADRVQRIYRAGYPWLGTWPWAYDQNQPASTIQREIDVAAQLLAIQTDRSEKQWEAFMSARIRGDSQEPLEGLEFSTEDEEQFDRVASLTGEDRRSLIQFRVEVWHYYQVVGQLLASQVSTQPGQT